MKCIEDYLALYVAYDKRLIMDDVGYIFIIIQFMLQNTKSIAYPNAF